MATQGSVRALIRCLTSPRWCGSLTHAGQHAAAWRAVVNTTAVRRQPRIDVFYSWAQREREMGLLLIDLLFNMLLYKVWGPELHFWKLSYSSTNFRYVSNYQFIYTANTLVYIYSLPYIHYMCICLCVCIYVYVYVYAYIYIYIYIYATHTLIIILLFCWASFGGTGRHYKMLVDDVWSIYSPWLHFVVCAS